MLERHPDCRNCPLGGQHKSTGIPTRLLSEGEGEGCLLIIGEKPGVQEDSQGECLVGKVGDLVTGMYVKYLRQECKIWKGAIYGTNAVRCRVPKNGDPTASQIKRCRKWLEQDVAELRAKHGKVIVLAAGAPACRSVWDLSLGESISKQGGLSEFGPVFSTNNPAVLLPGRDPAKLHSIRDHLLMLRDFLDLGVLPMTSEVPAEPDSIPDDLGQPEHVAIDIETYGAVAGLPPQTVFQPDKMLGVDGVEPSDLIQTVACGWYTKAGRLYTILFVLPEDFWELHDFLYRLKRERIPLLGMNIPFDVACLRAYRPSSVINLQPLLSRQNFKLRDLSIANFLNSDVRPERSLKEIAPLLRVQDYDEETSLKHGYRYSSKKDPKLHFYNRQDVVATLDCWTELKNRTYSFYRPTEKFSERCLEWFSDVLWTVIDLDEAGVEFNRDQLQKIHRDLLAEADTLNGKARSEWKGPIGGKGSQKIVQGIVNRAAEAADLLTDKRLKKTPKGGKISTAAENLHLLLGCLPMDYQERVALKTLERFRYCQKIAGTYTGPLLFEPARGLLGNRAYPSWYPVPTRISDDQGDAGGTQQSRLTCKKPALQTNPKLIKKTMSSRFPGGVFLEADLSQIELKVAALLSNDPVMMGDYLTPGVDRHASTALTIFGQGARARTDWEQCRQLGKTLNFLMLFKGGAKKYQETVREKHELEIPLSECERCIRAFQNRHERFLCWQEELIQAAIRMGYTELPITGESRTYLGGPSAIRATYQPTIVNFPVQATAASIMKSAQRLLIDSLRTARLQSVVCLNVYDACYVDCPESEEQTVRVLIDECLTAPPYYRELCGRLGRTLPLGHEVKVVARRPH